MLAKRKTAKIPKAANNIKDNKNTINIGDKNIANWNFLKEKLQFKYDCDFVEYLLSIADKYLRPNPSIVNNKKDVSQNSNRVSTIKKTSEFSDSIVEKTKIEKDMCSKTMEKKKTVIKKNKAKYSSFESETSTSSTSDDLRNSVLAASKNESTYKPKDLSNESSCRICDDFRHSDEYCPLNFPSNFINDSVFFEDWNGGEGYSAASLPRELEIRDKKVFSLVQIPYNTKFGPLVGNSITEPEIPDDSNMENVWELSEGRYLSTGEVQYSNWMRWVRPAPSREMRNLITLTFNGYLYFISLKQLNPGDELLYWAEPSFPWASKNMEKRSCGGCNITFTSPVGYRLHCSIFHDPSLSLTVRKYHCKVCGEPVLGKQNIINHAAKIHDGKGAYQCQFCSKFFLRLNYLEMHKNYGCPSNPHRSRPLCHHCGKKFCQPQKLKVHIKRMHCGFFLC